jgi:hypothetical protein
MRLGLPEYEADAVTIQPRRSAPGYGWLEATASTQTAVRIWSHRSGSYTDPGSCFNFGAPDDEQQLAPTSSQAVSAQQLHYTPPAPYSQTTRSATYETILLNSYLDL